RAGCGPFRYPAWRGPVAVKCATDPITSTCSVWNDPSRISRSPSAVSPRLLKSPFRLKAQRIVRACSVCRPAVPKTVPPNNTPFGFEHGGDVPDRDGLLRLGSAQAVEYVVECRRVERTINRQGLHHVRLDGGWVHRRKPAAGAGKHVRVRIEQGDLRPGRQPGVPDEVAGAGADIEMSASKVLAMALDDRRGGAPPDHTGHEAEHERVIDREEERVVTSLAPVRRIVAIHLP